MIGNSLPEWAFVQLSILIFRFTPLLYILALLGLFAHTHLHPSAPALHAPKAVLAALLAAEAVYYLVLYRPHLRRAAATKAAYPKALTKTQRDALFYRCVALARDPGLYLRGWFLGADLADIRRDNLREFFLWAFFELEPEEVAALPTKKEREAVARELDDYIDELEEVMEHEFEEGRGSAKSLRLTMDPVVSAYRGLAWYTVIGLVDYVACAVLRWNGWRFYARCEGEVVSTFPPRPQELFSSYKSPAPELGYWYYGPPKAQSQNGAVTARTRAAAKMEHNGQLPIVFLHGIGVGLLTYLRFLMDLIKASKAGNSTKSKDADSHEHDSTNEDDETSIRIIAIELLPVSFRLTSPPLDRRRFLDAFTAILDAHGWDDFALVSHSYGSVPTTHILTAEPALSGRCLAATLVDPVTVMLHLPHVASNFTRRVPRTAAEWQLWYFASADVATATVLGRHFFWRENIIWREDLLRLPATSSSSSRGTPRRRSANGPATRTRMRKVTVSLAGRDIILSAPDVARYLAEPEEEDVVGDKLEQEPGVEILWFPELDHAQVFDTPADYNKIINCVLAEANGD